MWISQNIPTAGHLSFCKTISPAIAAPLLWVSFSNLSLTPENKNRRSSVIRMGGGPRTYPGGVSKWQWKRMQAKKAKQLLKARLARERQIYQMRKRAELKAAVSQLERPWEPLSDPPPTLFSVSADDQLKVLADRFQKPGGLDLWSHRDGPQLFPTFDGLPSARFFPKGVVHSVKPYGKVSSLLGDEIEQVQEEASGVSENVGRKKHKQKNGNSRNARVLVDSRDSLPDRNQPYRVNPGRNTSGRRRNARVLVESRDSGPDRDQSYRVSRGRNTGSRIRNARVVMDSRDSGPHRDQSYRVNRDRNIISGRSRNDGNCGRGGRRALRDSRHSQSDGGEVYDMLLGNDGSYGLEA